MKGCGSEAVNSEPVEPRGGTLPPLPRCRSVSVPKVNYNNNNHHRGALPLHAKANKYTNEGRSGEQAETRRRAARRPLGLGSGPGRNRTLGSELHLQNRRVLNAASSTQRMYDSHRHHFRLHLTFQGLPPFPNAHSHTHSQSHTLTHTRIWATSRFCNFVFVLLSDRLNDCNLILEKGGGGREGDADWSKKTKKNKGSR